MTTREAARCVLDMAVDDGLGAGFDYRLKAARFLIDAAEKWERHEARQWVNLMGRQEIEDRKLRWDESGKTEQDWFEQDVLPAYLRMKEVKVE